MPSLPELGPGSDNGDRYLNVMRGGGFEFWDFSAILYALLGSLGLAFFFSRIK